MAPGYTVEFNAAAQRQIPISQIAALYVDNSLNPSNVVVVFPDTNFAVTVPANSSGYYPVITNGVRFFTYNQLVPTASDHTIIQILNFLPPALAVASGPAQGASLGTVTEIDSGPGLTGGPITTQGTISLIIPVPVASGGTGAANPANALSNLGAAPIASPTFTGVPAGPSAVGTTNTTQLATTAFARAMLAARVENETHPTDPASTTSMTGVMCGYAQTITPQITGRVLALFSGIFNNTTAGSAGSALILYGTGTPPANGAAVVGTGAGVVLYYRVVAASTGLQVPFTCFGFVQGLTLGTQYWFDLRQRVEQVAGTLFIQSSCNALIEI
jgi:hypothetical protein